MKVCPDCQCLYEDDGKRAQRCPKCFAQLRETEGFKFTEKKKPEKLASPTKKREVEFYEWGFAIVGLLFLAGIIFGIIQLRSTGWNFRELLWHDWAICFSLITPGLIAFSIQDMLEKKENFTKFDRRLVEWINIFLRVITYIFVLIIIIILFFWATEKLKEIDKIDKVMLLQISILLIILWQGSKKSRVDK